MKTIIEYTKTNSKKCFEDIEDKCCFYSGDVLYMKILQQDLNYLKINNANAISILNAGLTFFQSDEIVNEAIKEQINK
ncbi:TPA: hypothetical protein PTW06_001928 [Clostridium botulinum]|nr:hypothetical protein [Clostridium botulinum]HDK7179768.1 hypothetical protein [Clostridium botulinum]HDK7223219.1 hypothetical protein [Clostridium botulinum]HDK7272069.1 hypothetical protein [Clostridium botulinum]HDK7305420.1 hypothetical protein [Clostridium botulinum]